MVPEFSQTTLFFMRENESRADWADQTVEERNSHEQVRKGQH